MNTNQIKDRLVHAQSYTRLLLESKQYSFRELTPSMLENKPGVYAIFDRTDGRTLYVGRTKKMRRRLYTNHLMGPETNARLKKYLVKDKKREDIPDMTAAKQYLQENCYVQFIYIDDTEERGRVEGLLSFMLNVVYIHEEH